MPELPEVEIACRRLNAALTGAVIESATAPGMVAMKTFKPPIDSLAGMAVSGIRRVGKMPVVEFANEVSGGGGPLALLLHMMSAGRLQLFDKRASMRDRASRILVRIEGGQELRLREFGTKQRAWGKLLAADAVGEDEMVKTLGPEAWPAPAVEVLAAALDQPRHLHPLLRDQRTIAGIGRSWVDEILWEAKLSPFKKGADLDADEVGRLHGALALLDDAISHYEEVVGETIPDKMPMPLQVHRREGEPCRRCGEPIAAIHYADRITCYCPAEQTGGKLMADRRLSRLLK